MKTTINSKILSTTNLENQVEGYCNIYKVLENEIEEVYMEFVFIKGYYNNFTQPNKNLYDVLITMGGKAELIVENKTYKLERSFIAKIPYNIGYNIEVARGNTFSFLLIRKEIDKKDIEEIKNMLDKHSSPYVRAFSDCTPYTEDIKSSKTLNRMILPEGLVPRFCVGTVETTGPDEVAAHEHPMLEQLFLGLPNCNCTVFANNDFITLTENMIIHIPLGSLHSVKVDDGSVLSYVWLDFFKTLEGQEYMSDQHQINDE